MSYALLKKVCTKCRDSSIKTYWANIKALAKLSGRDDVPGNAAWLNDNLLKRVLSEPLGRSKRFATAGVKAAQMYNKKKPKWTAAMTKQTDSYASLRKSGKRTVRETTNWPKGGYQALTKLAKEMHSEVQNLETKKNWNSKDIYRYQRFLVVLFYSKHALRGDLADCRIKAPWGSNYIKKKGGKYVLHISQHKTSRSHGAIQIEPGLALQDAFSIFITKSKQRATHGYLLSTLRGTNRLKRSDMLRMIRSIMRDRLGKNIGVQLIRVLKVSESAAEIDKAVALQKELGHSAGMQQKYISRD